jgi:hypothetical protein
MEYDLSFMSTGRSVLLLLLLLAFLALSPGCLSTVSIGSVAYDGQNLSVLVTDSGGPEDAAFQVSVYRFQDFRQAEVTRQITPIRLEQGSSTLTIPLPLEEGTYRLYLYLIIDNARRASVIRDITVESHGADPRIGAG